MSKPADFPKEPKFLWEQFYNITQIPRPSKKEEKILQYLKSLADEKQLTYKQDEAGNIVIYIPATKGYENAPTIIIQNHVDMVTDALKGKEINFEKDPLSLEVQDGWLKADRTTLGADNGIGCAAALALIYEKNIEHAALELLFTVDEETGLNGALNLDTSLLSGKRMLNLDTEEWGSLYMGCAGGIDYELTKDLNLKASNTNFDFYELSIFGFLGGHSGVDIHEQRGNAIEFLVQALNKIKDLTDLEVAEIRGGRAHNIIPREAFSRVYFDKSMENKVSELLLELKNEWLGFLPEKDNQINFELKKVEKTSQKVISDLSILNFLSLFPHGVLSYQDTSKNLVSCSNNFARLLLVNNKFYTQTSLRFLDRNEVKKLESKLRSLSDIFNLKIESHSEYPSWKPNLKSQILATSIDVYKKIYNSEPEVTAIHAGLECGIIQDKLNDVDVISFGPTITGAHSPDERVDIKTVSHFWTYFTALLKELK